MKNKDIRIDEIYLSHLHFADEMILENSDKIELNMMLEDLSIAPEALGFKTNLIKTKIPTFCT